MDSIRSQLEHTEKEIRTLSKRIAKELSFMPEGTLRCTKHHGRKNYKQAIKTNEMIVSSGVNRNPELIAQLARKEFLLHMQEAAEKDHKLLEKILSQYHSLDPEDIMKQTSRACRSLPDRSFLAGGRIIGSSNRDRAREERLERHRKWAAEDYEQSTYKPEEKIHLTTSGIYVRSKSEALIMEKLYDYGASTRYEEVLWIDGRDFAPDYKFRDAAGEPFFWEHAGMMGDPQYVRRHLFKMREYERAGIVPWKNLIVTYDTVDGAVNMGVIDSIVRYQVLPRL